MQVVVDTSEIKKLGIALDKAEGDVSGAIRSGLFQAGQTFQSAARELVPVDRGSLRRSIASKVSASAVVVEPTEKYAADVEYGRPPGPVDNPAALLQWTRRKGLPFYPVLKKIERRGTYPQPYMSPAFSRSVDEAVKNFSEVAVEIISKDIVKG